MKLRIKGDSIRVRLTKTEVSQLCSEGSVTELTHIGNHILAYELKTDAATEKLNAALSENKITILVSKSFAAEWNDNNVVGISCDVKSGTADLQLKLEKDFVCLDDTNEDQSDNYPNPNATC
ncbi:MAG: hypothetical protein IPO27_08815 [Bacteroidetes bacterium]|nr:hypothetical protein [Bacteroidota bacterium]